MIELGSYVHRVAMAPLAVKGSDVNVAAPLLLDLLHRRVDAGLINPTRGYPEDRAYWIYTARPLRGSGYFLPQAYMASQIAM